jgi:AcrR family transcriptional regulator
MVLLPSGPRLVRAPPNRANEERPSAVASKPKPNQPRSSQRSTEQRPSDGGATPLSAVVAALERAGERGELSANEVAWSVARVSGTVRAGNPRLEGIDRRDSILRAAVEVFRRDGYNRATLEAVANELFISKAAVYHYFSSKQEILDAICERVSIANHAAVTGASSEGGDTLARLTRMLDAYVAAYMSEPGSGVLMRHLDEVSSEVFASVRRRGKEVEARFLETLEEGIHAGELDAADPHITVFGMLGAINYMYSWFRHDGRLSPDEVRAALVRYVLDGVRARDHADLRPARRSKASA